MECKSYDDLRAKYLREICKENSVYNFTKVMQNLRDDVSVNITNYIIKALELHKGCISDL